MATQSSILAWRIPRSEELSELDTTERLGTAQHRLMLVTWKSFLRRPGRVPGLEPKPAAGAVWPMWSHERCCRAGSSRSSQALQASRTGDTVTAVL